MSVGMDQYIIVILFAGMAVQYLHTMNGIHKEIKKIADIKCSDEYMKQLDRKEKKAIKRMES